MAGHRLLLLATVVGVNDGSVLYPCCIRCYTKMLHNMHSNVWHCTRCNISCAGSELTWRYRLSLCVADSSRTCNVSLFGGTLGQHFGCSANHFHEFLLHHLGNGEDAAEETIVQAVQTTLVGNAYVFCLKTDTPLRRVTADSGTAQAHPGPPSPLRLADLLNAHPPPHRQGGKLADFIAVQMVRTGCRGASGHRTVMEVLRSWAAGSASGSQPSPDKDSPAPGALKPAASRGRKTPVRSCRLKRRSSLSVGGSGTPGSRARRPRPLRSETGGSGCAGADCATVSSPRRRSSPSSPPSPSSSSPSPSCSPAEDFLSQNSSAGPSSAMFSCQSSMEREFPSGLSLTCSVRSWGGSSQVCPEGGEEDSRRGIQQRNGPSASAAAGDSSALAYRRFLSGSDASVTARNSCGSLNSETCSEPRFGATKRERLGPCSRNPARADETLPSMTVTGENGTDMTVVGGNGVDMTVVGRNGVDMTVMGRNGVDMTVMGRNGVDMTVVGENDVDMPVMGRNGVDMTVVGENGVDVTVIGNSTGSDLTVMADFESPLLGVSLPSFCAAASREELLPEVPESPHRGARLNPNLSCRKDAGAFFSTSLNDSLNLSCRKDAGAFFSTSLNDSLNLSCRKDAGAFFSTSLNDSLNLSSRKDAGSSFSASLNDSFNLSCRKDAGSSFSASLNDSFNLSCRKDAGSSFSTSLNERLNLSCRKDAGASFSTSLNDSLDLSSHKYAGSSFSTSLNDSLKLSSHKDAGASFSTSLNDSWLLLAACEANENPLRPGGCCRAVLGQVGSELLGNGAQARLAKLPEQNPSVSACEGATGCHNTVRQSTECHSTECQNTVRQNTGRHNAGCHNTECHNTARHNTARHNTARHNTGRRNTGCRSTSCHGANQTEPRQGVINACAAAQNAVKVSLDADTPMPDSEDLSLFLDVMAGDAADRSPENPEPRGATQQPKQAAAPSPRSPAHRRSGSGRQPKAPRLDRGEEKKHWKKKKEEKKKRVQAVRKHASEERRTLRGGCAVAETSAVTPTGPAGESGEDSTAAPGGLVPEEGCSCRAGRVADAELDRGSGSAGSQTPGGDPPLSGDSTLWARGLARAFSFQSVPACVPPDGPSSEPPPVRRSRVRVSDKQLSTLVSDGCPRTRVSDKQLSSHVSDGCSRTRMFDKQLSSHVSDQPSPTCMSDKQLSDRHSPTCVSDKQLSTHVSDRHSPTCMSDKQLSDRHSPTCVSDKQLSTHVSDRHSPTCMSDKRSLSGMPDNDRVSEKESDRPGADRRSPTHQGAAPGLLDMPDSEDLSVFLNGLVDAEKDAAGGRQDSELTRPPAAECSHLATGEPRNGHSNLKWSSGDSAPAPCLSERCRTRGAGRERRFAYEPPDVCRLGAPRSEAAEVAKERDAATDSDPQGGAGSATSGSGRPETELRGRRARFARRSKAPSKPPRDEAPHRAEANGPRPARLKSPGRVDGVLPRGGDRPEGAEGFLDGSAELFSASPSADEGLGDVDRGDFHPAVRPARKPPASAREAGTAAAAKNDRFGAGLPSDRARRYAASSADERPDHAAVSSAPRHRGPDASPAAFHRPADAGCASGKEARLASPAPKAAYRRQGTPAARRRRKVRFSRTGRVSSVSAMDSRLQRYGSPQPGSQSPRLTETPARRPRGPCLRQPPSPPAGSPRAAQQRLVRSAAEKRLLAATRHLAIRHSTPRESALKASAPKHGAAIRTTPKSRALEGRDATPTRHTTRQSTPKHSAPKYTVPKRTPKYTSVEDTTPKRTPQYTTVEDTTPKRTPQYTTVEDTTPKRTPKYTTVEDTTPKRTPKYTTVEDTTPKRTPKYTTVEDTTPKRIPKYTTVEDTTPKRTPKYTTVKDAAAKHTAMPTSAKQASNSPENSGSQDLFSPCLAPHRAEGVDQDPQAPASPSVEEMRTPQGGTWGGAPSDSGPAWSLDCSASRGCHSLCLFDESAVLFDDVENVPETLPRPVERLEVEPTPGRCSRLAAASNVLFDDVENVPETLPRPVERWKVRPTPGRCSRLAAASNVLFDDVENVPETLPRPVERWKVRPTPGRCTRLAAASAVEDKVAIRVPGQRALSELHNFSLASLASPDLFSP